MSVLTSRLQGAERRGACIGISSTAAGRGYRRHSEREDMQGSHCALPGPAITMTAAAAYVGSMTGQRPSSSTCWRWAMKGARGNRLQCQRIGGTLYTTEVWIDEFLAAGQERPRGAAARSDDARPVPGWGHASPGRHGRSVFRDSLRGRAKAQLDGFCNPRRQRP